MSDSKSDRSCGQCSLCCKLLEVREGGVHKSEDRWCPHARPGKGGCAIYQSRPAICADYLCLWRAGVLPDYWYPPKSGMITNYTYDDDEPFGLTLTFHVDPGRPTRWREEPYLSELRNIAMLGLSSGKFRTRVRVGKRNWHILPDREVEYAIGDVGIVGRVGNGRWEYLKTNTEAEAKAISAQMEEFRRFVSSLSVGERLAMLDEMQRAEPSISFDEARQGLLEELIGERNRADCRPIPDSHVS